MTSDPNSSSITDDDDDDDDDELIRRAQDFLQEEQLLAAARLLRRVSDPSKLTPAHRGALHNAKACQAAVDDLLGQVDHTSGQDWKKQGESHGSYSTTIYYKVDPSAGARLTTRIETPIPFSLLVPLLSVLNESDLYGSWIPSWKRPKLRLRKCKQLINDSRGHQIIQIQGEVQFFTPREILMDVIAVDDIDEQGFIIAKMRTLETDTPTEDLPEGFSLPEMDDDVERIEFDGAFLFRACPKDHPSYSEARKNTEEDLILLQFTMFFDAHMTMVPKKFINFITRTVIGMVWKKLLKAAEQVRDGTLSEHKKVIEGKSDLYDWVRERAAFMLKENIPAAVSKNKIERNHHPEKEHDGQEVILDGGVEGKNQPWTMEDVLTLAS
jgi:hypothetical protein